MSLPASLWLAGCGNMGRAMLDRWLDAGLDAAAVTVIDPYVQQVPAGVRLVAEAPEGAPDVLVLAIKPQQLEKFVLLRKQEPRAAGEAAAEQPLLISILAGVEEATLRARFAPRAVIRAMPNLPVSLGRGVVALHSDDAAEADRAVADTLMAPLGLVEWIAEERQFDAVTALSGSGPGFVYRLIEAFTEAGTALGLPADQSQRFAAAMVEGAGALAMVSDDDPATLANCVASPGGTTRAGLDVLDRDEALKKLIAETLTAAARRSEELAAAARNS